MSYCILRTTFKEERIELITSEQLNINHHGVVVIVIARFHRSIIQSAFHSSLAKKDRKNIRTFDEMMIPCREITNHMKNKVQSDKCQGYADLSPYLALPAESLSISPTVLVTGGFCE